MMRKSFRSLAQTCENEASWTLAEILPSNRSMNFLDGNGKRPNSIL
jgi:hypothetical protein